MIELIAYLQRQVATARVEDRARAERADLAGANATPAHSTDLAASRRASGNQHPARRIANGYAASDRATHSQNGVVRPTASWSTKPQRPGKQLLRVDGLAKEIGGTDILRDINFSIYEEDPGLIGPNGAGKTTLMECLAGMRPRSAAPSTSATTRRAGIERSPLLSPQ